MYKIVIAVFSIILASISYADCPRIHLFPLDNYDQDPTHWIDTSAANYHTPLLTSEIQEHYLKYFRHQFFAPWDRQFITSILENTDNSSSVYNVEKKQLDKFDNSKRDQKELGFGENYHPYAVQWIEKINGNVNINSLKSLRYLENHRAILIENAYLRTLPTHDAFYTHKKYPFDLIQHSALYSGMPIYIIQYSHDSLWALVRTPSDIGWLPTTAFALANTNLMSKWSSARFITFSSDNVALKTADNLHLGPGHMGMILPLVQYGINTSSFYYPVRNKNGYADFVEVFSNNKNIILIPLPPSPENFVNLIHKRLGQPYGFGDMHFYHDSASELKALFSAFGIWLPRNTAAQTKIGYQVDVDKKISVPGNVNLRLKYLKEHGHPFVTFVYVHDHIMLYLGKLHRKQDSYTSLMSYQMLWGLKDKVCETHHVIGQTVLFPLLNHFSEDPNIQSQAEHNNFMMSFLDQKNHGQQ